jgi:hypothetical protein
MAVAGGLGSGVGPRDDGRTSRAAKANPGSSINNPNPFATNPGWHAFFDQDGDMAEKTRRRVYDMVAAEKLQVQGFHYPFPGLANIEKDGSGYRVVPTPWNPTI